jgi:hypothetical protein
MGGRFWRFPSRFDALAARALGLVPRVQSRSEWISSCSRAYYGNVRLVIGVLLAAVFAQADASLPSGRQGNWGPLGDGLRCRLIEQHDGELAVELRNESRHVLEFLNELSMNRETAQASFIVVDDEKQFWASGTIGPPLGVGAEKLPVGTTRRYAASYSTTRPTDGMRIQAQVVATPQWRGWPQPRYWTGEISCGGLRYAAPRL